MWLVQTSKFVSLLRQPQICIAIKRPQTEERKKRKKTFLSLSFLRCCVATAAAFDPGRILHPKSARADGQKSKMSLFLGKQLIYFCDQFTRTFSRLSVVWLFEYSGSWAIGPERDLLLLALWASNDTADVFKRRAAHVFWYETGQNKPFSVFPNDFILLEKLWESDLKWKHKVNPIFLL